MTVQEVFGNGGAEIGKQAFVFKEAQKYYDEPGNLVASVDNYESPTFIQNATGPREQRMKQALVLLFTIDRVPLLYSGNEIALSYEEVGNLFAEENRNATFLEFFKTLTDLRRSEPALRRGDFELIDATHPILAFTRTYRDETILVVLNCSAEPQQVQFCIEGRAWEDTQYTVLLIASLDSDFLGGQTLPEKKDPLSVSLLEGEKQPHSSPIRGGSRRGLPVAQPWTFDPQLSAATMPAGAKQLAPYGFAVLKLE